MNSCLKQIEPGDGSIAVPQGALVKAAVMNRMGVGVWGGGGGYIQTAFHLLYQLER